ncbi:MAG: hypothetical protein PVJ57_20705 [Phycisphaerae bacterium]|jgi:hypothetical protein
MAKRITSNETTDGWQITIDDGDRFAVTPEQVRRLRAYLSRLITPADARQRCRLVWKEIVCNDHKLRRPDGARIAVVHRELGGETIFVRFEAGSHTKVLAPTLDDFVAALRAADREIARTTLMRAVK